MDLNEQIEANLHTLEVLYFFTEGLKGNGGEDVRESREHFREMPREIGEGLLAEINSNINGLRDHYGALSANHFYEQVRKELSQPKSGLGHISKLNIDRLFFPITIKCFLAGPTSRNMPLSSLIQKTEC